MPTTMCERVLQLPTDVDWLHDSRMQKSKLESDPAVFLTVDLFEVPHSSLKSSSVFLFHGNYNIAFSR